MLVTKLMLCCLPSNYIDPSRHKFRFTLQMFEIKEGGNFRLKTCCLLSDFDTFKITVSKNKY